VHAQLRILGLEDKLASLVLFLLHLPATENCGLIYCDSRFKRLDDSEALFLYLFPAVLRKLGYKAILVECRRCQFRLFPGPKRPADIATIKI
jgi:hypothetical protein